MTRAIPYVADCVVALRVGLLRPGVPSRVAPRFQADLRRLDRGVGRGVGHLHWRARRRWPAARPASRQARPSLGLLFVSRIDRCPFGGRNAVAAGGGPVDLSGKRRFRTSRRRDGDLHPAGAQRDRARRADGRNRRHAAGRRASGDARHRRATAGRRRAICAQHPRGTQAAWSQRSGCWRCSARARRSGSQRRSTCSWPFWRGNSIDRGRLSRGRGVSRIRWRLTGQLRRGDRTGLPCRFCFLPLGQSALRSF